MPERALSKKIGVTHLVTDLDRGGAETFLHRLVSGSQSDICHRVLSLTGEGDLSREIRAAGVQVQALSLSSVAAAPVVFARLVRLLRRNPPDVLMTWLYHADFFGTVAAALGPRTQLVWNIRCADMDLSKYGHVTRMLPHVLSRFSRKPAMVVVNSQAGREIHERYGYGPKRWEVLPNGFDVDIFRPDSVRRATVRLALGVGQETPVIGLFARYDPMKDHATFLAAAEIVLRERPDAIFLLAGRRTESADFERLIGDRESLRTRLIRLGERRDIPDLMAATDIVVCSSLTEGFPNTIGEAMACGVPCISTDVGDAAELIGDTGALVPKAEPAALAHKLEQFLQMTPETRVASGAKARRRIEAKFSLDAIRGRYAELFRELALSPRYS